MAAKEKKVIESLATNAKCEGCGSSLIFDPKSGKLKCPSCGSEYDFDHDINVNKHSFSDKEDVDGRIAWSQSERKVQCDFCGGTFSFSDFHVSEKCPYCGNDWVLKDECIGGLRFDGVVPFAFDKKVCAEKYSQNIRKKLFAPSAFKKKQNVNSIGCLYVPSFVFDNSTFTTYSGILTRTETYRDSKGNTHTRYIDFPIAGTKEINFNDFVIECSHRINSNDLRPLLPFEFDKGIKYTADVIRGFQAETNAESLVDCYKDAKKSMETTIKTAILSKYSYSGIKLFNMDVTYSNEVYRYYLLPFYEMVFNYKNKTYKTYVNGQTGKIGKGYPKSPLRIALAVLLGLVVLAGIIVLIVLGMNN